jgi:spermidine synthase
MAGLALGGYLLGRWIDRTDRPLAIYGIMELMIGLFALLFLFLLDPLKTLYIWIEHQYSLTYTSFSLIKFLITFVLLIVPTTLMGGTFPVLAKFISESDKSIGKDVSVIYGANVLGAVIGCLLAAFVLINGIGIENSIFLAVLINGLIALWALYLVISRKEGKGEIEDNTTGKEASITPECVNVQRNGSLRSKTGIYRLALLLSAFSGFATLALQVLWTRTYVSMLSANTVVFSVILSSFLTGLALGSLFISRWIDRIKNLVTFIGSLLLLNGIILIIATLSLKQIGNLFEYLHIARSTSAVVDELGIWVHFFTLFLIILIPSTAMGTIFPTVIRLYARSLSNLGRKVGQVYAINTMGAILGSFISGFVLIPFVGNNSSVCFIGAFYSILAAVIFVTNRRPFPFLAGLFLTVFCLVIIPFTRSPHWYNAGFIRTRDIPLESTLFFEEGVSANVGIIQRDGFKALTVDGIIVAQNSRDDMWDLLLKAHLPLLLHPDPQKILLIGLGGGISLGAVEKHDVERIDCVELSPEVVRAHYYFEAENDRCWEDERLNLIINDGRHYLLTTENQYDIISVDPVDPPVSTLYTQDFFRLCRNALEDNGLMLQWVPMFRLSSEHILMILKSFTNEFPNTTVWYDGTSIFLLGRKGDDDRFDYANYMANFSRPEVRESLAKIDVTDPNFLLATFIAPFDAFRSLTEGGILENTDNNPRLEYSVLLARGHSFYKNLELLSSRYQCIIPFLEGIEGKSEIEAVERYCTLMKDLLGVRIIASEGNVLESRKRIDEAAARLNSVAARHRLNMKDIERMRPFWQPIIN